MIIDSELRKTVRAEDVNFATFAVNTMFIIEPPGGTPFEVMTGRRPHRGRVLRFGTRCCFHNIQPNKGKLNEHATARAVVET